MSGAIASAVAIGVSVAATVAGSVMSAVGQSQQAQAQKNAYEAQAQANDYNATVQKNNAISVNQQTSAQEDIQRRQFAQLQGEANAGIAQSGTGQGGSNALILKQNAVNNEMDALNIRYQGQQRAQGLMAESQLSSFNASQDRVNGQNAITAGKYGAAASLISGIGNAAYYGKGMMAGKNVTSSGQ